MALVRSQYIEYYSEKEKEKVIYQSIDKLIMLFPNRDPFSVHSFLKNIEPNIEERNKLHSIVDAIRITLENLEYIEHPPFGNSVYILTNKGEKVKKAGGHFKFIKKEKLKNIEYHKILTGTTAIITVIFVILTYKLNISNTELKNENTDLKKRLELVEAKVNKINS